MKTKTFRLIALGIIFMIVIFFVGWAMIREMSNGGMNESEWGELSWMLIPALIALGIADLICWSIFRKKWWPEEMLIQLL